MSAIEFMLSLFGVLIGFILVEVMSGLMRTLRARLPSGPGIKAETHIGWLTPMLGGFTMLNVLLCWVNVWEMQTVFPFGYDTLTIGLALCAFYYFAASMIFPADPRAWPDVDEWFWLHRRPVLGCILVANLPWIFTTFAIEQLRFSVMILSAIVCAFLVALVMLTMFARTKWIVTTALATLVALHVSFAPIDYLVRHGAL